MMRIIAVKMTDDIESIKVIYEKNGSMYVRNGSDSFTTGLPVNNINIFYKFGFKKISNPPNCNDRYDIQAISKKLEIQKDGTVKYVG